MRAFDLIAAKCWAIQPNALRTMLAIANRETAGPQAVSAELGRPLDNTRTVSVRDGVAVIPVSGPIFRHANMFTEVSGATSIELLATDFTKALNDSSIQAIVLDIDSPGGEVAGVNEFSNMIYAARGVKPVTAYVGNLAASAAYWIASACDGMVVDVTAMVGSIGVIATVTDPTAETSGDLTFISSQSPKKRLDPTSESGQSEIQAQVDELATIFVSTVARNRGVSEAKVLSDYGRGGVLIGRSAVKAGLADAVGSFEQTVLASREMARLPHQNSAHAKGTTMAFDTLKRAFGRAEQPEPVIELGATTTTVVIDATAFEEAAATEEAALVAALEQERAATKSELDGLRAKLEAQTRAAAEERERAILATAQAFADRSFHGHTSLPSERETLVAQYAQAMRDDIASPLATPRTDGLQALINQRQPHALTNELVAGNDALAVLANSAPKDEDEQTKEDEERRKKLKALTPLGRQALTH